LRRQAVISRTVVFDVETDGLLDDATVVHSLCIKDVDSGASWSCADQPGHTPIESGLDILSKAGTLVAHNAIDFDVPVLEKLYPEWEWEGRILDTLLWCRTLYAHVKELDYGLARKMRLPKKLIGSHGLEAWGHRIGVLKGEYHKTTDWSQWTPEMQAYCRQDVDVNAALLAFLDKRTYPLLDRALGTSHELGWYLSQQERNGWPFDFQAAVKLQATLSARREELGQKLIDHFGTWEKKGKLFTPKRDNKKYGYKAGVPFQKMKTVTFNPASRAHIADRLQTLYGWEPKEFTPSGQPQVDEGTLKGLDFPVAAELNEYLLVTKRLGQLAEGKKAWLLEQTHERPEGGVLTGCAHIHHSAHSVTITHRHRHAGPNVAQVPTIVAPYGKECRALWTVPPGWQLLGADVSGLELRCLAHYLHKYDGGEYAETVLSGDVHQMHAEAMGVERPDAKTLGYAYLYGAGNTKLGAIVHPEWDEEEQLEHGKKLRRRLETRIPALGALVKDCKRAHSMRGHVRLIDGRRAHTRSGHSALNTLLQGTGSVICMEWIVRFNRALHEEFHTIPGGGWHSEWAALGWIHDEVQLAIRPEHAGRIGEIVLSALAATGEDLEFRLPLDGEVTIGVNWAETH
jgi:hypothetical protein